MTGAWEYRVTTLVTKYGADVPSEVTHLLNAHGRDGWELAQYTPSADIGHPWTFIFKRPGTT